MIIQVCDILSKNLLFLGDFFNFNDFDRDIKMIEIPQDLQELLKKLNLDYPL